MEKKALVLILVMCSSGLTGAVNKREFETTVP